MRPCPKCKKPMEVRREGNTQISRCAACNVTLHKVISAKGG